jgi:hypothetical protein
MGGILTKFYWFVKIKVPLVKRQRVPHNGRRLFLPTSPKNPL